MGAASRANPDYHDTFLFICVPSQGIALLPKETTPSRIVKYLDQYVIGQDEAKKIVSVAVYSHYRKISTVLQGSGTIAKSNVLLIGSSGTGKTLLCETLSRMLDVPFVTADATSLAQTKYVNEEIEAALQRLVDKAKTATCARRSSASSLSTKSTN